MAAVGGGAGAVVCGLVALLASWGAAPPFHPVPAALLITTLRDTPVKVTLSAIDEDIDPNVPAAHPLVFRILTEPANGKLSGDLSAVVYEAPHKASVTLTYTPQPGFVGTDMFIYSVEDPFGLFATATVQVVVARPPGPPPTLSGTWEVISTFDSAAGGVSGMSASLGLFYTVDIFRFDLSSTWSLASGWTSLSLVGSFPLGELARVRSTLSFSPAGPSFQYWQADTRLNIVGLDLTHTLYLNGSAATSYSQLVARGQLEGISFTSVVKFGLFDAEFREWSLNARSTWACCKLGLATELRFLKTGFDYVSFAIRDVPLPGLLPNLGVNLGVTTKFTPQTKSVTVSFTARSDWHCCVRLLTSLQTSGTTITGVHIYGFELRTTLAGGIEVWAATAIDPNMNGSVTGYPEYFEVWTFSGPMLSCCGSPGRWQIATYFDNTTPSLFGWGRTRINLEFAINEFARALTEFTVRNDAFWELKLGLRVRW